MAAMNYTTEISWLHDNHNHVSLYASLADCHDIAAVDPQTARSVLESCPPERLSLVSGWKSNELEIDEGYLAFLPPVLIVNRSLHGFLVSPKALPLIETFLPGISRFCKDKVWMERNVPKLFSLYGSISGMENPKLMAFMASMEALGFGSLDDMALTTREALRVITSSPVSSRIHVWAGMELANQTGLEERALSGIKFFLDGSLGARTAALSGGFIGAWNPILCYEDAALLEAARSCSRFPALSFHAIGDLAIGQALRVAGKLRALNYAGTIRIEHAQFIDEEQARTCKDSRVILSMQPNFTSDSVDYRDRLSETLCARNNPFRMLIDTVAFIPGEDLIFGSDGMPHGVAWPLQASLFPPFPGQALELEEFIAGYGLSRGISGITTLEIDPGARRVRVVESKKTLE